MGENLPALFIEPGLPIQFPDTFGNAMNCVIVEVVWQIKCWGSNLYGQLGYEDTFMRGASPSTVPKLLDYVDL